MIFKFANDKNLNQIKQKNKKTKKPCQNGREVIIGYIFQMWERKGQRWTGQQLQGPSHSPDSPSSGFFSTSLCRWAVFPQTGFSEKEIWLPKAPDLYFTHLCPKGRQTLIRNPSCSHRRIFPGWIESQVYP